MGGAECRDQHTADFVATCLGSLPPSSLTTASFKRALQQTDALVFEGHGSATYFKFDDSTLRIPGIDAVSSAGASPHVWMFLAT
jgi:hypothetical protein